MPKKEKDKEKKGMLSAFGRKSVHKKDKDEKKDRKKGRENPSNLKHINEPPPAAVQQFQMHLGAPLVSGRPRSNSTSFKSEENLPPLQRIPRISDARGAEKKQDAAIAKMEQCCRLFNFEDALSEVKSKEIKQDALVELHVYFKDSPAAITDVAFVHLVKMFQRNCFRTLPPPSCPNGAEYDPEEDEPTLEVAWPHLKLIYEMFLIVLESKSLDIQAAKGVLKESFVTNLLYLFDCEDPRERDFLKTILHRMYGKFINLRAFIRRTCCHVFYKFAYEVPGTHNGIAELLEIYGSIINGFATPLKKEHKDFLTSVLLPLHKVKSLAIHHPQLAYCVLQFLAKDPTLVEPFIKGLLKMWPKVNSPKEVMFIAEVEDILEMMRPEEVEKVKIPLFQQVARCVSSPHFQVAERCLYLWSNKHILELMTQNVQTVMPIILPPLYDNSKGHWNKNIHALMYQALRLLMSMDNALFDRCLEEHKNKSSKEAQAASEKKARWEKLEALAEKNPTSKAIKKAASKWNEPKIERQPSVHGTHSEEDDTLSVLKQKPGVEQKMLKNTKMRRKSFLPHDQEVQKALQNHHVHTIGLSKTED